MSVIRYNQQDFANVAYMLNEYAKRNESMRSRVRNSQAFMQRTWMLKSKSEAEQIEAVLDWMVDHLNKANSFAFCSQYGDSPDLSGEYPDPNVSFDLVKLERKLRSIDYNLADNCGNTFVSPYYYELFQSIITLIHREYWDEQHDESDRY